VAGVGLLLPFLPRPKMLPFGLLPLSLVAGLLAGVAVLLGAITLSFHGERRERLQKGLSLAVLVAAVGLRFGWLGAAHSDARPIAWLHDEAAAIAQAQASGKPILVDFFADWCAACKELDLHTFSDPEVQRAVTDRFVPLKVDATDESDEVTRLTSKYGVPGLPTVLMLDCAHGNSVAQLIGPGGTGGAAAPVAAPAPAAPAPEQPAQASCSVPHEGPGRLTGFEPPDKMLERIQQVACAGQRC
jgi:thiol:disulfide interchange protein